MKNSVVFDYIIELVESVKKNDEIYADEEKWTGSTYILGQIIRQYCIPINHYFVSKKAKALWDSISSKNILDYWYQHKVKCESEGIKVKMYSGNSNSYKEHALKRGEEFIYRSVFHDEHVVPVKIIIEKLCSYEELTREDIKNTFKMIRICKMLKEEDKLIPHKSNRPLDYKKALARDYFTKGIEVYAVDENGQLKEYEGSADIDEDLCEDSKNWPVESFLTKYLSQRPETFDVSSRNSSRYYRYIYPISLLQNGKISKVRSKSPFSIWVYLLPSNYEHDLKLYCDKPNGQFSLPNYFELEGKYFSASVGSLGLLLTDEGIERLSEKFDHILEEIINLNK